MLRHHQHQQHVLDPPVQQREREGDLQRHRPVAEQQHDEPAGGQRVGEPRPGREVLDVQRVVERRAVLPPRALDLVPAGRGVDQADLRHDHQQGGVVRHMGQRFEHRPRLPGGVPPHRPPQALHEPQSPQDGRPPDAGHRPVGRPQQGRVTEHLRGDEGQAADRPQHDTGHVGIPLAVAGPAAPSGPARVERPDPPTPREDGVESHQMDDVVATVPDEDAAVLQRQHADHVDHGHGPGPPAEHQQHAGDDGQRVDGLEPRGAVGPHQGREGVVVAGQFAGHPPAPGGVGPVQLMAVGPLAQQVAQPGEGEPDAYDGRLVRAEGGAGDAVEAAGECGDHRFFVSARSAVVTGHQPRTR